MATAEVKKTIEKIDVTQKIEDSANKIIDLVVDSCNMLQDDVKSAREEGSKFAKDLTANIKINDKVDSLISDASGIMGEMVAGGMTAIFCPMKVVSKEMGLIK